MGVLADLAAGGPVVHTAERGLRFDETLSGVIMEVVRRNVGDERAKEGRLILRPV
jgi:hypothetical protein